MGIDPGSRSTGWGIISDEAGRLRLVDCGVIRTQNSKTQAFSQRLVTIYHDLCIQIKRHRPVIAAIEQAFVSQNAQSALKLGHARGVAVAACASLGLDIFDYEPTMVKKTVVGVGRAEKEQVAFMVKRILNISEANWGLDTSDALAVAICHASQARYLAFARKCANGTGASA